ncbi:MAG: OprO/OprP family phosphate-selective porin [Bacteroidia bacterium]|nr:OprO/OprP family phosphate-selective porin [Bacteroidia bacterium]
MKQLIIIICTLFLISPLYVNGQGCMEPSSDDGVSVVGYIQPQVEYRFLGDDLRANNLDESSFYFNRVRLGVVGSIPYDFSYYAMTELSPTKGGPIILDAYVSYNRLGPWATISVGQFRSPFGLELSTPCHKLHTINRSQVVETLAGPFRDMGFMISGGTDTLSFFGSKTTNFFGYNIALMNGTGKNVMDDNRKKDLVGRVTIHPFDFITIGASYRFGKHPTLVEGATDDERSRYGFDLELKYNDFMLQGEYISGSDVGSYTTGGGCDAGEVIVHQGSVDREGFMVQAMYRTPWNLQPVIKFETYDPNIIAEESNDRINTMTLGLNVFPNDWTRVQINYLYNAEKGAEIPNDEILVQVQALF